MNRIYLVLMTCAVWSNAPAQYTVAAGSRTANHPNVGGFGFAWYINGVESPALNLVRGQTYTFQMSGVPVLHPFYISTSVIGGGLEPYTAGLSPTPPVSGNTLLTFTVPSNAPSTLYYQCMVHQRMGWKLNITSAMVTGRVTLSDYVASVAGQSVLFEVLNGSGTVESHVIALAADGTYSFPITHFGTFDLAAKWPRSLRKLRTSVTIGAAGASAQDFVLINGDVDGDNEIGPGDFGGLSSAFGSVDGDANWNANADLDGDGEVGPSDFGILSANFGLAGD